MTQAIRKTMFLGTAFAFFGVTGLAAQSSSGPSISSINPNAVTAGSSSFILTVNGAGYTTGSVVQWNGTALSTTYVSESQLTASITANLIANPGGVNVRVMNPPGVFSNTVPFAIYPATTTGPAITGLNPSSGTAGTAGFTLTVNGTRFVGGSLVQWNGTTLPTTYVGATQLTASVAANLFANTGNASVTVMNPGGAVSNVVTFAVNAPSVTITSLSPSSTTAGSAAFTLTVNGTGFVGGPLVEWNGTPLPTTDVSATELTAFVAANLFANAGNATVTVMNAWEQVSNPLTFTITPSTVTSLAPAIVGVGGKVHIQGSNLGSAADAVVVFSDNVIAEIDLVHTATEVVARVPYGAQTGPVTVLTGVDAATLRDLQVRIDNLAFIDSSQLAGEIAELRSQKQALLSPGTIAFQSSLQVTMAYLQDTSNAQYLESDGGIRFLQNRIIVDLVDFESFDVALEIGSKFNADLVGYLPFSNSYIMDLRNSSATLADLDSLIAQVLTDSRVAGASKDFELVAGQAKFADVDWVDRYRHTRGDGKALGDLNGRLDAWPSDRIQAPGAWNLLERWIPARDGQPAGRASLFPMKVALYDTGVDQDHPEFAGVGLKKWQLLFGVFILPSGPLPLPAGIAEIPWTDGDDLSAMRDVSQHGTAVGSLIGAANGTPLPESVDNDRGINGLLHNPMRYTLQVSRVNSSAGLIVALSAAALTGARVLNASNGTLCPIRNTTIGSSDVIAMIQRLDTALSTLERRVLLVNAAGNCAVSPDPAGLKGKVRAFVNGMAPTDGIHYSCSLGLRTNVMCVASIDSDDQRSSISDWGTAVAIAAPGENVLTAGDVYNLQAERTSFLIGNARYARLDGTSFAAPLVAGTASLLLGVNPRLEPTNLKQILVGTSFPVNTSDGNGDTINSLPTLKSGWAVRQVLLNMGCKDDGSACIQADDPWTGVSKIVYPLEVAAAGGTDQRLMMAEIRRSASGRSEAFAVRAVQANGVSINDVGNAALTHDGRQVTWITFTPPAALKFQRFDQNAGGVLNFGGAGVTLNSQLAIGYNPQGDLFVGINDTVSRLPNCLFQMVRLPAQPPGPLPPAPPPGAQVLARTAQPCGARGFRWYSTALSPDNRKWRAVYLNGSALGNTDLHAYTPIFGFAPKQSAELALAYPPDSNGTPMAELKRTPGVQELVTFNGGININQVPMTPLLSGLHWSPDGSELAYSGVGGSGSTGDISLAGTIQGIRRDAHSEMDRDPVNILQSAAQPGTEQIFFLSWHW